MKKMNDSEKSLNIARSRAPINIIGVKWWDLYGEDEKYCPIDKINNEAQIFTKEDKSTGTDSLSLQRDLTVHVINNLKSKTQEPKHIVYKKWKEDQTRKKYEQARKAVIKSLKDKFAEDKVQLKTVLDTDNNTVDFKDIEAVIVKPGDNAEGTSKCTVNHDILSKRGKLDFNLNEYKVGIVDVVGEEVSHARKLQMGPGGVLAQWRLAPRGSEAEGALDSLRGLSRIDMPVSDTLLL